VDGNVAKELHDETGDTVEVQIPDEDLAIIVFAFSNDPEQNGKHEKAGSRVEQLSRPDFLIEQGGLGQGVPEDDAKP
jgi:hypothetical protein